jgi:hypothetical protein
MRTLVVLCGLGLSCAVAAAQGDDYRTLNDCMAGEFQTSIDACTRLIVRGGHSATQTANLYTLRGYAHAENNDRKKALADFGKAIELAPLSFGTCQLRSLTYMAMGEHDSMREVIGLSPRYV